MILERAILAPAEGRRVRKPDGALLDAGGEDLALTPYWRRRIADGDVIPARRARRRS